MPVGEPVRVTVREDEVPIRFARIAACQLFLPADRSFLHSLDRTAC